MAGSSEPAFLFLSKKMELMLHRLFIYFATAPSFLGVIIKSFIHFGFSAGVGAETIIRRMRVCKGSFFRVGSDQYSHYNFEIGEYLYGRRKHNLC